MSLVKSKQRVADHGEVFTPAWLVEAMLDLVKDETERIDSRFLEPACGDGNFLVPVLRRKLAAVESKYGKSDFERQHYALLGLMCLYGIELLPDNITECRANLLEIFAEYLNLDQSDDLYRAAFYVLSQNLVHGDALTMRTHDGLLSTKPRRSICYACEHTHVLLPTIALLRRFDVAEAIGEALVLKAAGWGHRRIAAGFGVPSTTVRDWLRRFALRAEAIRSHFTALAYLLDSSLGAIQARGSPQGDAVEAMVVASCCAARRFGPGPLWQFVSGASGGRLLSNTSSPFPALQ